MTYWHRNRNVVGLVAEGVAWNEKLDLGAVDSHFELIATVCRYFRKVTDVLGGWVVPVVRLLGAAGGRGGAGEGGLGDSQIQPKKEVHRHESTWYNEEK